MMRSIDNIFWTSLIDAPLIIVTQIVFCILSTSQVGAVPSQCGKKAGPQSKMFPQIVAVCQ